MSEPKTLECMEDKDTALDVLPRDMYTDEVCLTIKHGGEELTITLDYHELQAAIG